MITGWKWFDNLNDKLKHFIVMAVFTAVILLAFGKQAGDDIAGSAGIILMLAKEWYDGWKDDWIFDLIAGFLGMLAVLVAASIILALV